MIDEFVVLNRTDGVGLNYKQNKNLVNYYFVIVL